MKALITAIALATMSAGLTAARAGDYPSRPITIIVPFAAGGPSDVMARILANRMKSTLGQTVLVENVTGASGSIGVTRAVRSPPDGYTISFGHLGTHVANGAIFPLTFDLVTDLEPVSMLPSNPMIIVSKNDVPAKTLKELVAWVKENSGKVTVGTAGSGSGAHVAGVYFQNIRHQAAIRAISRHRPGIERFDGRTDRPHYRPDIELYQSSPCGQNPRLRRHG